MNIDAEAIVFEYYRRGSALADLLIDHCRRVRDKALAVADALSGAMIDIDFINAASLLHDIGIIETDAPSIHCHGSQPYICHGIIGRRMLEAHGLERLGPICERHIGTGITIADIRQQQLPLPLRDMVPATLEEIIVCYADKFFSKSNGGCERRPEEIIADLARYGPEKAATFKQWHSRFDSSFDDRVGPKVGPEVRPKDSLDCIGIAAKE